MTVQAIAKLIAGNWADWPAYMGKAKKVVEYIKKNKQKDLFDTK